MGTIEKPYPEQEVDQFGLPYWRVRSWEELCSVLKKCPYASIGSVTFSPNGDMELELNDNKVWGIKEVVEEAGPDV